ncbi:MAG: hypothetical protein HC841_03695 [Verrucomicrobiae bacterium]|nr:hypothetical protein [Verrucomicrobiae bacterium]
MKPPRLPLMLAGLFAALLPFLSGCESAGGGASVSGGIYYGTGFYDPWHYGPGYYPPTVVVPPPRPERPVRPEHPIARPPSTRPAPSIPSMPRVGGFRR